MTAVPPPLTDEAARRARVAFWVLAAILAGNLAQIAVSLYDLAAGRMPGVGFYLALLNTAASAVSFWLHRRRWVDSAVMLNLSVIWLVLLIAAFTVGDAGLLLAAILVLITLGAAASAITPQRAPALIVGGLVAATVIVLADLFLPYPRTPAGDLTAPFTVVGLASLVYLVFIARQFAGYSLRTKLITIFLAGALLPAVLLGGLNTSTTRQALVDDAQQALKASAVQLAAALDAYNTFNLESIRTEALLPGLRALLNLPALERTGSPAEAEALAALAALARRDPVNIVSYALYDLNGRDVADTVGEFIGSTAQGEAYFTEPLRTGLPYASPVQISQVTGRALIHFSAPVRSPAGEVVGVVRAAYNAAVLQQIVVRNAEGLARGAFAVLLDENLIYIGHSNYPELLYRSVRPLTPETLARLQAAGRLPNRGPEAVVVDLPLLAGSLERFAADPLAYNFVAEFHPGTAGETVSREQAGAARLSTQPWVLVAAESETTLLAPALAQTRNTILLSLAVAAAAALVALLMGQLLSGPIVRLTQAAQRLAAGDLTARAPAGAGDEIGLLAQNFNTMAAQVSDLVGSLEQRVADRTRALNASAEVSRRLSTLLDQDQLVRAVVEDVQRAFKFYHVHIYLFDETHEYLVMTGGTGEAGAAMLASGHRLARGRGLVGRAADTNASVLVGDVSQAQGWLPNPLLPDTRAEAAVPIAVGAEVLGVLDVQHNVVGGLRPEDVDLLQAIANQMGVALQNARSYARSREDAAREARLNEIVRQIQSTRSVQSALQVAAREVGRALGAPQTRVRLETALPDTQPERNG